jgi:TrmH family RNA methyltransferase
MKPISWYKSLSKQENRRECGCFVVEGRRGVDQLLAFHRGSVRELLCADDVLGLSKNNYRLLGMDYDVDISDIPIRIVSPANMKSISSSDTPQGIAAVVRMPEGVYTSEVPAEAGDRVLLLEDVQDPGNVGTLVRTAAAFGYGGAILSGKCADPFSPKVVRSTAGSLLSLWIRRSGGYMSMVDELLSRKYELIAADLGGDDTYRIEDIGPHVLILGNEGEGLSRDILDKCARKIRIPIKTAAAESLNVAVSGGIAMFMCSRK